jgi:hypothetical protein
VRRADGWRQKAAIMHVPGLVGSEHLVCHLRLASNIYLTDYQLINMYLQLFEGHNIVVECEK